MAKFSSNSIFKFADDTTVVGWISNNDKTEYRDEIENLVNWCGNNNLSLNVNKTKCLSSTSGSVKENMSLSTSMGTK